MEIVKTDVWSWCLVKSFNNSVWNLECFWCVSNIIVTSYCCMNCVVVTIVTQIGNKAAGLKRKLYCSQKSKRNMSVENIIELSFKHEQVWVLSVMLNELNNMTTRGSCWTNLEPQAATSPVWRPQLQVWVGILTDVNSCAWLVGLGVWFSLRVREVPGSNPGRALLLTSKGLTQLINLILKTWGETQGFRVAEKLHIPELNSSDTCKQEETDHTWEVQTLR